MTECKTCNHELPAGFCHACCRDFPPETMSADPRYCPECFDFLSGEAKLLNSKKADWKPRQGASGSKQAKAQGCDTELDKGNTTSEDVTAKILAMSQNKSCRVIEKELSAEGVTMSYRTVARIIKRERQGVLL